MNFVRLNNLSFPRVMPGPSDCITSDKIPVFIKYFRGAENPHSTKRTNEHAIIKYLNR